MTEDEEVYPVMLAAVVPAEADGPTQVWVCLTEERDRDAACRWAEENLGPVRWDAMRPGVGLVAAPDA